MNYIVPNRAFQLRHSRFALASREYPQLIMDSKRPVGIMDSPPGAFLQLFERQNRKMRLLVIHSNKRERESLRKALAENCFAVEHAPDCGMGSFLAAHTAYDLVIAEHAEPINDVQALLTALRKRGDSTPVIVLIPKKSDVGVEFLECGADDFLEAPISYAELLARVRSILRRPRTALPESVTIGDLVIDLRTQRVTLSRREVLLSPNQYAVLEYLAKRRGAIVSKTEIIEHTWGETDETSYHCALSNVIFRLRQKLKSSAGHLQTVSNRGYQLD